jgi:PhoH-like ATPase
MGKNPLNLLLNQYIVMKFENGKIGRTLKWDGIGYVNLHYREMYSQALGTISPLNNEQRILFDLLQNESITIKQITGVAGSGKNFCTMAYALERVFKWNTNVQSKYKKIVLIRNNIEVKNCNSIGALPAGINEKLLPYAMPAADILGGEFELMHMIKEEKIELVHLGFIRGRSFENSIIIVDEAENLTSEHVSLLVSRVGNNSVILFLGDMSQTDKDVFEKNSGLQRLSERLPGNLLYGAVYLKDTERSPTARLSLLLQ